MNQPRYLWRGLCCLAGLAVLSLSGCNTLRTLEGIPAVPAHRVPPQFLGMPRANMQEISMLRLRQRPPAVYQLGPGDILGIYIETVLGEPETAPPIHFPEDGSQPPAIGFPIPVREDGTLALPLVAPIPVTGLTLAQATDAIRRAYTVDRQILPEGRDRVIVTLIRRREYRVLVVREESGGVAEVTKRGAGFNVDLPAYENDLLHALNETGGLPGVDASSEVLIYRGGFDDGVEYDRMLSQFYSVCDPCAMLPPEPHDPHVVRVPLRFYPHEPPTFTEEDIILQAGDIVMVKSREQEKFYTGGVLGGGEFLLPRDYDLDILGAIAIAGGPVGAGGTGIGTIGAGGFGGFGGAGFSGGVPPSRAIVLRKTPGGQIPIRVDLNRALMDPSHRILIQPEDVIIVQYTCCEELYNAALNMIRFNFLFNGFRGNGF